MRAMSINNATHALSAFAVGLYLRIIGFCSVTVEDPRLKIKYERAESLDSRNLRSQDFP